MLLRFNARISICALVSTALLLCTATATGTTGERPIVRHRAFRPCSPPNDGGGTHPNVPGQDSPATGHTAQEVIDLLGLVESNEKGYFVETFRDTALVPGTNRSVSTAIYYLLEGSSEFSYWHRVDAAEVWHWYAGAPLSLFTSRDDGNPVVEHLLGGDLFAAAADAREQRPQAIVAKDEWQRARSWGDWSLVGTTGESKIHMTFEINFDVFTNGIFDASCPGLYPVRVRTCAAWLGAEWFLNVAKCVVYLEAGASRLMRNQLVPYRVEELAITIAISQFCNVQSPDQSHSFLSVEVSS